MDIVALSLLPHCAPFPTEKSYAHAQQWAMESLEIFGKNPGLYDMRAQRTLSDLIAMDWPEGLEALGQHMVKQDASWWNPKDINQNPLALAAHQNRENIVKAMIDEDSMGKLVETPTLASTLLGTPDIRHFNPQVLHMLVEGIQKRRDEFITYDREDIGHAVAKRLLGQGHADLIYQIYGRENMPAIEHAWLKKAVSVVYQKTLRHGGERQSQEMMPLIYNPNTDSKDLIGALSNALGLLFDNHTWQTQGNTIFQVYMDHAPEELPDLIDRLRPMLDGPGARQTLPRMKAWEMRAKLMPQAEKTPSGKKPGGM